MESISADSLIVDNVDDEFFTCSLRLPQSVSVDFFESIQIAKGRPHLFEDWSRDKNELSCSACGHLLDDVTREIEQLRPCLLPSATWGFEDMRVCEECGPLVHTSHHGHTKKSKAQNFYIADFEIMVPLASRDCPACGAIIIESELGTEHQESLKRVSGVADFHKWKVIKKSSVFGASTFSASSMFWAKMIASDARKIQVGPEANRLYIQLMTGIRDIVVFEESGSMQWSTRVLFTQDATVIRHKEDFDLVEVSESDFDCILSELKRFSLHACLSVSKKWSTSLAKVTPIMDAKKHYDYLVGLMRREDHKEAERSMHSLFVELNKLNGIYWIVSSASFLQNLYGIDVSAIINASKEKLTPLPDVTVAELGGPLRALSLVQLCVLLKVEIPEKIKNEAIDFLKENFSAPKIFWFDMRSLYCSLLILRLTNSLNVLPKHINQNIIEYIYQSQSVLGGFGAGPRSEAHGGYTFCAVACIKMLHADVPRLSRLTRWLQVRLSQYNGRPGKPADSCYVWWCSASMVLIGRQDIVSREKQRLLTFINNNCLCPESGGYSKFPSIPLEDPSSVHGKQEPDLLHTFLAIACNALLRSLENPKIDPVSVLPTET